MTQPVAEGERIASLDVLRGFALLGILLLNILGFGLLSNAIFFPDPETSSGLDTGVWGGIELAAEGAMRALFSMLFGAGVLLLATGPRAKSAAVFFKRHFWLLMFGVLDMFVLLWLGDILIVYALAGMLLFFVRNASARRLLIGAAVLMVLMSSCNGVMGFGLNMSRQAAEQVTNSPTPQELPTEVRQSAEGWQEFAGDYYMDEAARAEELQARSGSYLSAFAWNYEQSVESLLFVLPTILIWDALLMMLLGMALYKMGVMQGERSRSFYWRLMLGGFAVGLSLNAYEVAQAFRTNFDLLASFPYFKFTYHLGRCGMALGYVGALVLLVQSGALQSLLTRLSAVGRMALTNYLMHSVIGLFVFTGAGLGLVGELTRFQLYGVVLAIWVFQLWFSPWWLARYHFGPLEWVWRWLTYGSAPPLAR